LGRRGNALFDWYIFLTHDLPLVSYSFALIMQTMCRLKSGAL
jgi:hypothetical protein